MCQVRDATRRISVAAAVSGVTRRVIFARESSVRCSRQTRDIRQPCHAGPTSTRKSLLAHAPALVLGFCLASALRAQLHESPRILDGHTDQVTSVVFSPDGKLLATGSFDNAVGFWDVAAGRRIATAILGYAQELEDQLRDLGETDAGLRSAASSPGFAGQHVSVRGTGRRVD
jgi:WD40 repeat protein